ncbi:MAG: enoyl-CoA hydratase/isomerase family protein [Gemmatimonadetes bacterium]|nr:enoyl-CoA hydratase/isomerase family protein [Gemmatimonadota bacterium]
MGGRRRAKTGDDGRSQATGGDVRRQETTVVPSSPSGRPLSSGTDAAACNTVHVEFSAGIARLTLDHPPVNILTRAVMAELRDALGRVSGDESVRVVVFLAGGKHFSAGADVGEHLPPAHEQLIPEFLATVEALLDCPVPLVAGVRGRCLGGGFELVQAADLAVAGEGARFGQPEIVLGVLPPAACALLPVLTAPGVAAELVLTGDPMTAADAERAGLVRRVVPDDRVDEEALAMGARIARHSRAALVLTKKALRAGRRAAVAEALAAARGIYLDDLMATRDALEGLRAFQDKREPVWSHR